MLICFAFDSAYPVTKTGSFISCSYILHVRFVCVPYMLADQIVHGLTEPSQMVNRFTISLSLTPNPVMTRPMPLR